MDDDDIITEGMQTVKQILAENYVRPDEAEKVKSKIKEMGNYKIIDKVANLFYNMSSRKVGLVGVWDVVAFDEVAGIKFKDKDGVQIMKDFMASGSFSRGRDMIRASGHRRHRQAFNLRIRSQRQIQGSHQNSL